MKPWKKLSEKIIRLNKYRSMKKVRYQMPDGKKDDFFLFDRGRVIAAVVVTPEKKIVLAKQFRLGPEEVLWELPGGAVEKDEQPRQAVVREIREEVGYAGKVKYLGNSTNDAWSTLRRYHFLITDAKPAKKLQHDDHEFIETVQVSLPQFRKLIRQGKLSDAETAYRGLEYLGWL